MTALIPQIRRWIQTHTATSKTARDEYVALFPVQRRFVSLACPACLTHVYEAGKRGCRPLLLIHGGVVEAASWLETATALADDRHVLAPDLPAHGLSGYLPAAQLLTWLEAFVEAEGLKDAAHPFDLCGHSMGGGLALQYAARHPDLVRRLILCAPIGMGQFFPRIWPAPWTVPAGLRTLFPLHRSLLTKIWGDASRLTAEQRRYFSLLLRDLFLSPRWWWYLSGGWQQLIDLPLALPQAIRSPTLFLWGDYDRIAPFHSERTRRYVQAIPNARLILLRGLGHLPQIESPAVFNQAVREFLEG